MTELDVFSRSIKDFFTFDMLKIALVPLLITIFVVYLMFFTAADYGISSLQEVAKASQNGQEVIIDPNAPVYYEWAANSTIFLFQYSVTSWLAIFLIYTIGSLLMLQVSVIFTLALIGFFVPMILGIIHKRHYSHLNLHGHGNLISPLIELVKSGSIMILLYVVFIPLYFIPFINVLAFSFPLYYFFHKLLNHDVSSTILSEDEYEQIYKKNANSFRLRTLFLYLVSLIPFITLFTAVFYVIYLGHAYFIKLEKLNLKIENKNQ